MKKPITLPLVKRKLFIGLLILLSAFTSNAQWSYIATVKSSGDESWCSQTTSVYPFTNFPTKSLCENSRQWSLETFNTAANHCYSTVFCTPCMGSDIGTQGQGSTPGPVSIPGQVNPGDFSINGILEGKAIFTSHQSSAFEDWASEYKQLLASYGITSILGKNFTIPKVPLTDDKYVNALYTSLSANFNPKTAAAVNPLNQDASVVDLSYLGNKTGTVNPNDLKDSKGYENKSNESLHGSYVPPVMKSITDDKIKEEEHPYIEIGQDIVIEMVPPGWVGYGLKAGVNLCFEDLKAAVDVYNGKPCPSTSTMITNALLKTAEGIIDDKAMPIAKKIGIKSGLKPLNIYRAVKTYEWASATIEAFQEGYKFGTDLQKSW